MATTQTYASLTAEQKNFYDRTLLSRLLPFLTYAQYGQKRSLPRSEGDTVQFRRFNALAAATTPLTEGTVPSGNTLSVSAVNATVAQYGDFIQISDKLDFAGIDPVLTETAQLLGEQAGLTIDTIVRDIVTAGTTVQYANGRTSRATVAAGDNLTGTEVKKAVRTLRRNNAQPLVDGKHYIGLIGPNAEYDLMSDSTWCDVSKYAASTQIFDGELGSLYGVRFIRTGNPKVYTGSGASGIDVTATMILGRDAYGVVDVEGSSRPQVIIKELGSAGTADPLNQMASAGWKVAFAAVRLNELAMVRIEHATTA